jgi:(p)ppGpp synthase/HD superfamily hydrolase
LLYPQESVTVAFCHDVREDYGVSDAEVRSRFGPRVADAVDAMTKTFRGVDRPAQDVFDAIAASPIASVVKVADRVHNHHSMVNVFSVEKVADYAAETRRWFLPMLKSARRTFCEQEPVYESLSLVLDCQLALVDAFVDASSA